MRISRDQMFMEIAHVASKRSTCFRRNVGAVVVLGARWLVAIGYNGPASGEPHCTGNDCLPPGASGCTRSVHAEINALDLAQGYWHRPEGLTIYTTVSPCNSCVSTILLAGVERVVYEGEYRDASGLQKMVSEGIQVHRLTPSGYCVEFPTGRIVEGG
jgi:dCMP deaminase